MSPGPSFGAYVHFPYCRARCPYCDFAVEVVRDLPQQRYADAVLHELDLRAPAFAAAGPLGSIFFGGGTPSLWDAAQIARVCSAIQGRFPATGPLEVTLEANPDDLDRGGFAALRDAGVNRLSLGVQTFDDGGLRRLGRAHSADRSRRALSDALAAGFASVSLDLIYGWPGQSVASAADDGRLAAETGAAHVSAYALTLDELAVEVPMARWAREGRLQVLGPDAQADTGTALREALTSRGLRRYEISNFAKAGAESAHNRAYWCGEPYLGLGVGAFGSPGAERYGNCRDAATYLAALESGALSPGEVDPLDEGARFRERVFLGLRMVEGLARAPLARDFGSAPVAALWDAAQKLAATTPALLVVDDARVALTDAGLDLHSAITVRLI